MHARGVLSPQSHVRVALLAATCARILRRSFIEAAAEVEWPALEATLRCVVTLESDDRIDAVLLAGLVEVVGAVEVAVIGHREGCHAEIDGLAEEIIEAGSAVEHGVLGVHVQVDEVAS